MLEFKGDEKPEAVKAAIEFMYTRDYTWSEKGSEYSLDVAMFL